MKFIALIFIFFSFFVYANLDEFIMPSQVKPGMLGYGKTVFRGTKIEKFNVEVLGVLKNSKFSDKLVINGQSVLVKTYGKKIEKNGGIAAGMSGAPIYVKGKLLGALSAGWTLTDHSVGIVTPISEMLKLTYPPYMKNNTNEISVGLLEAPVKIKNQSFIGVAPECMKSQGLQKFLYFHNCNTPLMISGLKSKYISEKSFNTISTSELPKRTLAKQLEPGAAIGVQLARGDVNITSLGTLTYYDKKRNIILAFGHPFLHKGDVNYFLSGAYIYYTFSSIDMPFKVGAPLGLLGSVVQDRQQGIVGIVRKKTSNIPLKLLVTDKDHNITKLINVEVVKDYQVLNDILSALSKQSLDETINEIGSLSIRSYFDIGYTINNKKQNFAYENMFYTDNPAEMVSQDILATISQLVDNEFTKLDINSIDWQLNVTSKRKTARIVSVKVPTRELSPGEVIGINVTIKPFRQEKFVKTIFVKLPKTTGSSLNIIVEGGHNYRNNADEKENFNSLADIIDTNSQFPQNNEIIIRWTQNSESNPDSADNSSADTENNSNTIPTFAKKIGTEYVLDGYFENILVFK
jgi:hypothetical protein